MGGARLSLPSGWVAEAIVPQAPSQLRMPTWCLMPKPGPAPDSQDAAACAISLAAAPTGSGSSGLSVDTPGGMVGNPEFCSPQLAGTRSLLDYADTTFGTRPADYRRWLFECADGTHWSVEQYVADNAPGYVLSSSHATAAVHDIMKRIAGTAQLPAISRPLRLSDFGYVRSVSQSGDTYHVQLDRVVQGIPDVINNNPQTYGYDVPASALLAGKVPKVGALAQLQTNGVAVTWFFT